MYNRYIYIYSVFVEVYVNLWVDVMKSSKFSAKFDLMNVIMEAKRLVFVLKEDDDACYV